MSDNLIIHPEVVEKVKKTMLDEHQFNDMSILFKMFADPTRLKILKALFESEMCVGDLAALLDMSHSAISHQLSSLRNTRLIRAKKDGKVVYYSLNDKHIEQIFKMAFEHISHE